MLSVVRVSEMVMQILKYLQEDASSTKILAKRKCAMVN